MTTNGILGQNKVSGATLTNYMENPDLKWETTSQVNLGIDYGFFSRLSGNLDFFEKYEGYVSSGFTITYDRP